MLLKLVAVSLCFFAVCVFVIQRTGVVSLEVHDPARGEYFFVPVPMIAVSGMSALIPDRVRDTIQLKLGKGSHSVSAAVAQLATYPDTTFVEVEARDGSVKIAKQLDYLMIELREESRQIQLRIPIDASSRLVARLLESD